MTPNWAPEHLAIALKKFDKYWPWKYVCLDVAQVDGVDLNGIQGLIHLPEI